MNENQVLTEKDAHEILTRAMNHLWHWFSYIHPNEVETYKAICAATCIINEGRCKLFTDSAVGLNEAVDALNALESSIKQRWSHATPVLEFRKPL